MITVQYNTKIKGFAIKAVLQISGNANGSAQIVVSSISVIGLDLFGVLKAQVAKAIVSDLTSRNIIAFQNGSTVTANIPGVTIIERAVIPLA